MVCFPFLVVCPPSSSCAPVRRHPDCHAAAAGCTSEEWVQSGLGWFSTLGQAGLEDVPGATADICWCCWPGWMGIFYFQSWACFPSSSEWFSMNVVTDGFAAFDKIHRCVGNCRLQLRLFSSENTLLFDVGVTLCLPSGSGATRVTILQATACCYQLHSWNSWACPGVEGWLTGLRSLTAQSLAQEAGFSWHTLKYIYLLW